MKSVGVADLKARLSEHLRYVRTGHELTVLDRNTPIARLVPLESGGAIGVRRPVGAVRVQDVRLPDRLDLGFDVVQVLMEEREADR